MMTPIPRGWEEGGLCAGTLDPRFFPTTESGAASASLTDEERAAAVCRRCPVQVTCMEKALDIGRECVGIWGGLGSAKRRRLRQARSRQLREGFAPHRFTPGCSCSFCIMADGFLDGRVIDMNTEGARCGYRSTYARGHRDTACTLAAALHTRRINTLAA